MGTGPAPELGRWMDDTNPCASTIFVSSRWLGTPVINYPPMMREEKYRRLCDRLRGLRSVAVAFSGGADSALVLKAALDALGPAHVVAVTGRSDSLAAAELEQARVLAQMLGAEHVILDTDEFADPHYTANPSNRCYYCKTTLYAHMDRLIAERGLAAVVSGTNADDLGDFRPGLAAAGEHRVVAPLAEAGLTKADVRELSRRLGLPTFDKPASPCLSSRVPYGEEVTPKKLRMIEAAEALLHEMGIRQCRVRHHAGDLARIEVEPLWLPTLAEPETAARIDADFRRIGYRCVTLDLGGFRSGGLNATVTVGMPAGAHTKG